MKYFVIAPHVQDIWKVVVEGMDAGNTYHFMRDEEARMAYRREKPDKVYIVKRIDGKIRKQLAKTYFSSMKQ